MTDLSDVLTVPDAAKVAGVSERTMRRWATNGQVRTVGRGHRRRVVADSLSEPPATNGRRGHEGRSPDVTVSATTATGTVMAAEAGHLADLVRELTARVSDLSATAGMWQARARVLEERVLALEAPKTEPGPPADQSLSRRLLSNRWLALAVAVLIALLVAMLVAPAWVR